jgi:hypothetical protein
LTAKQRLAYFTSQTDRNELAVEFITSDQASDLVEMGRGLLKELSSTRSYMAARVEELS